MMISLGADGGGGKICGEGIRTIYPSNISTNMVISSYKNRYYIS